MWPIVDTLGMAKVKARSIISVGDGLITSVQLYLPRHALLRADSGPFLLYYICCFSILLIQYLNGKAFSYVYKSGSVSSSGNNT